eukprot:TRINITY_DN2100_c0_g1_i1.p1 TRINITY_DN2100_c0_g1~~TRINITY_DN2100_c0_g1_i1.p1  ORF type:complete len:339 (+),score=13.18 TRINITY_DN2100_c0_g1_i1:93-1109(+)
MPFRLTPGRFLVLCGFTSAGAVYFRSKQSIPISTVEDSSPHSQVIVLGSGTSEGVPRASCLASGDCKTCHAARWSETTAEARNYRRNTSLLIQFVDLNGIQRNVCIDVGKIWWGGVLEFFPQLGVKGLDAVILTHSHFDAIGGLDSLRDFTRKESLPVYTRKEDMSVIKPMFPYMFDAKKATGSGFVPQLDWKTINPNKDFTVVGDQLKITPIEVEHGRNCTCLGFRVGPVAYLSDISKSTDKDKKKVDGCTTLIIDCLEPEPQQRHSSHFVERDVVQYVNELKTKPKQVFLTGLSHNWHHTVDNKRLAEDYPELNLRLAFDGLKIPVNDWEGALQAT